MLQNYNTKGFLAHSALGLKLSESQRQLRFCGAQAKAAGPGEPTLPAR